MECFFRAKGYQPDFPSWCAGNGTLGLCPIEVPDAPYLALLYAEVKADCDAFHAKAMRSKGAEFQAKLHSDLMRKGGKIAYAMIRDPGRPPVDQLECEQNSTAKVTRQWGKNGTFRIRVDEGHKCYSGQKITCDDNTGIVDRVDGRYVTVKGKIPEGKTCVVRTKQWITDAKRAGEEISAYWNKF